MHIIVFEDDSDLRSLICNLLEKEGYTVECVNDLQLLRSLEFAPPDLFIIDRSFEAMTTPKLCRYLKQESATSAIPVLVMASKLSDINECLLAGANASIQKPFTGTDLLAKIQQLQG